MQVIQDTNLGGRLGASLGAGLNQLAQHKLSQVMQQYEKAKYAQGLAPLLGNQTANFLSNLGPDERKFALDNIDKLIQLQNDPEQEQSGMGTLMHPQQNQQGQNPRDVLGAIANMIGKTPEETAIEIQKNPELQRVFVEGVQIPRAPQQVSPQVNQLESQQKPSQPKQTSPDRAKLIKELFTSPKERIEREKLELQKKKITSAEDLAAWKNTQTYREKVLENEQTSREALEAIKEAQELEKSGEFPSQQFASFLKGAEWEDIPGFLSGSAEAFNKVLANFQRGAKDIYGGRITNFEMEQFLKTIPTLQHTPEGRARIWAMMKNYYRGGKEVGKLERRIIKENGGKPPQDLHEQVNEKFEPIAEDLARTFKKDLKEAEKLQSSSSSRIQSALAYGAGKLVSGIPGAIKGGAKGAATGAAIGSFVPAIGTGLGALIGGGLGALGGESGLVGTLKHLL